MNCKKLLFAFAAIIPLLIPAPAKAAVINNQPITFNESGFPTTSGTALNGSVNYDLINNTTGEVVLSGAGDGTDFSISYTNSSPSGLSTPGNPIIEWNSNLVGSINSIKGYFGTVSSNNPGSLTSSTITLTFSPQVTVNDFVGNFSSINNADVAWKYAVFQFFKTDGTPFTPQSSLPTDLSWIGTPSAYNTANALTSPSGGQGYTGSPAAGWYIAANTDTVFGVGTNQTASFQDGPKSDLVLTSALAQIAGQDIGSVSWTTFLEDTRGINSSDSNTNAYWNQTTFSGSTQPAPEPLTVMGSLTALGLGTILKKKMKKVTAK
jgi:hypothetical protein